MRDVVLEILADERRRRRRWWWQGADLLRPVRVGTAGHPDGILVRIFRRHTRCPTAKLHVLRAPPEDIFVALAVLHVLVPIVDQHNAAALRLGELNQRGFHHFNQCQRSRRL